MTAIGERGEQGLSTILIRASLVAGVLAATFGLLPEKTAAQEAVEVAGTVVDDGTGEPIEGATVRLADASGSARETITGLDGTFAFSRVVSGEYTLAVRHLGYEVLSAPVDIGPLAPPRLDVRLQPDAIPLEPLDVDVAGRAPRLVESGFYDRMDEGWGTYFEPAWLEANKAGYDRLGQFLSTLQLRAPQSRCPTVPVFYERVQIGYSAGLGTSRARSLGDPRSWRRPPRHDPNAKKPAVPALLGELSVSDLGAAEFYTPHSKLPFFAWNDSTARCGAIILWSDWTAHLAEIPKIEVKLCEPDGLPGEVVLDGVVEDEVTEVRLPAATVFASYMASGEPDHRRIEVRTDSLGRYRVCDLPEGTAIEMTAAYGPHAGRQSVVAVAAASGEDARLTVPVTSPGFHHRNRHYRGDLGTDRRCANHVGRHRLPRGDEPGGQILSRGPSTGVLPDTGILPGVYESRAGGEVGRGRKRAGCSQAPPNATSATDRVFGLARQCS